jgi:hypothetical protein
VSTTDADSGFFMRHGKPQGFFYLEHRTVDAKYAIVTDAHITPGNVGDPEPYLDRLLYQTRRFVFSVELDAGYHTGYLCTPCLRYSFLCMLTYRTVDREGKRHYRSCLQTDIRQKDLVALNRRTPEGKMIFRLRHNNFASRLPVCQVPGADVPNLSHRHGSKPSPPTA